MNRDQIIDLSLANILDIIPLISNIDNEVNADINAALVTIYERNMAILNAIFLILSTTVPCIEPYNTVSRHDTSLLASFSLLTDVWIKAVDKAAFLEQLINRKHRIHCKFNLSS